MEKIGFLYDFYVLIYNFMEKNWISVLIIAVIFVLLDYITYKVRGFWIHKRFRISLLDNIPFEVNGVKAIKVSVSKKNKRIAYEIWVELMTRKIALDFDEENDVIEEVYNSWYSAFGLLRDYVKLLGEHEVNSDIRDLTLIILNQTMRNHLTRYQARLRKWLRSNDEKHEDLSPQLLQKEFPDYLELVADLRKSNTEIKEYLNILMKIYMK